MSFRRRIALTSGVAVALAVALASVVVYVVVRGQLRGQLDASLRDTANGAQVQIGDSSLAAVKSTVAPKGKAVPPINAIKSVEIGKATRLKPIAVPVDGTTAAVPAPTVDPTKTRRARKAKQSTAAVLTLPKQAPGASLGYTQVVTEGGNVLRATDERGATVPVDGAKSVAAGNRADFFADVDSGSAKLRVLTARTGPGVAVQVVRPLGEVDSSLNTLIWTLIGVTLGGALLASGVGYLIARRAVAPVRALTDAAEHVTRTRDLGRRIGDTNRDDELAGLAVSFDAMLAELEGSVGAQRRLVADASHELRTPLTSLRTNIEVLLSEGLLDQEDRERLRDDVVSELEQLGTLVGDIVELARDDEVRPEQLHPLRLDRLVEDAVRLAERRARDVRFELRAEPTSVNGDSERLMRAIANLLDNAAKWSPPGGVVEVGVADGEATVRDHGPGIGDEDRPFVFERFYRAAGARATPGSGLGLAIVAQTAESHGGSAAAEAALGGGALLRLRLPVAQTAVAPIA